MPKLDLDRKKVMERIVDETNLDELLRIMDSMDAETRALVLQSLSKRLDINGKKKTLTQVRQIIAKHDNAVRDWLITAVAESYTKGANVMYADIRKLSISPTDPTSTVTTEFTPEMIRQIDLLSVHKDAINALASDAYLDFANGMNGMVRGVEKQLNEALKKQIRAINISKQITGTNLREISKEVQDAIGQRGFSVLIDRGGREWSLRRYSDMLTRTHVVKAANEGTINRAAEYGVDLVQVSRHGGSCKICQPYEGNIYSLSGESKKYPKLNEQPPYHPNCRHSLLPRPFIDS